MSYQIHHGDNREVLKNLADNSIDSVVTDPPYELGFMGKSWDATGVAYSVELWQEVMRVLKPGGHLLAFSGSRTYHRMAVAIEDAGFEIRDQIMWIYGSGFPKSHDVSKAIDKNEGHWRGRAGKVVSDNGSMSGGNYERTPKGPPYTEEAKQWQGWGTALKPAHEPIVVARKPLIGTVAANVLTYGTGGLNIDASRVGNEEIVTTNGKGFAGSFEGGVNDNGGSTHQGRWPANVIHDGSDEVVELFPTNAGGGHWAKTKVTGYGEFGGGKSEYFGQGEKDGKGSAARFFYCAKASKRDRNEGLDGFEAKFAPTMSNGIGGKEHDPETATKKLNHHPTVKPTELMRYLCRMVTPPGGIVLDPFMGSGSTGKAAMYEGFEFVGIELTDEYLPIAKARIEFAIEEMKARLL
jgi:site-specific DNA-methyltransferase (adenine-specific)